MKTQKSIQQVVSNERRYASSETELAIAIHNYVRDNVLFGFTPYFDVATPEQTLNLGIGHCNPQATLMVALLREAGIPARFRPVTIDNDILFGVARTPRLLSHVYTEVYLNDKWLRLDSYIVDPKLKERAIERLKNRGRQLGFGTHVAATSEWDGKTDAYSQVATQDMILDLHDPFENIEDFYRSSTYQHQVFKLSFSTLMAPARLASCTFSKIINYRIERLRA